MAEPGFARCAEAPAAPRRASIGLLGGRAFDARYGDTARFVRNLARIHAVNLNVPEMPPLEASERLKITTALESVRRAAAGIPTDEAMEPVDDPFIGRLLVATDFDVARSVRLAHSYADFRRDWHDGFRPPGSQVAGRGVFLLLCEDRKGRPVLLVRGKHLDAHMSVPALQRQFRAFMDAIILHMLQRRPGLAETNALEQYICVVDAADAGWANASMGFARMLLAETNTYYPERLQEVIVLGVNVTIRMIWRVLARITHPRTQKKVKMVPPDEVASFMRELVPEEGLPADYGGCAPALEDPALLEYGLSARHVGALASEIWECQPSMQQPVASPPATDECPEGCSFSPGSSCGSSAPARRRPSVQSVQAWRGSCMGGIFESVASACNPCVTSRSPGPRCQGQRPGRTPQDALGEQHPSVAELR